MKTQIMYGLVFLVLVFNSHASDMMNEEDAFFDFEKSEDSLTLMSEVNTFPKVEIQEVILENEVVTKNDPDELKQTEFSAFEADDPADYEEDGFTHYDWWSEH